LPGNATISDQIASKQLGAQAGTTGSNRIMSPVTRYLGDDDKGTVIHDLVGPVINLIALRIFGAELTISGEKVRMHVWYGAFAWLLRVGDLVGG